MPVLKSTGLYFICLKIQEHMDKFQVRKRNIWIWRKNIVYTVLELKMTFFPFSLPQRNGVHGKAGFLLLLNFQHKMALLFF